MSTCTVTEAVTHTTAHGLEVEVTITRDWRIFTGSQPDANDVPRDIRDALVEWLDGAR